MKENHVTAAIKAIKKEPSAASTVPNFLKVENCKSISTFHATIPNYHETPLVELQDFAKSAGVRNVLIKDESKRFGLNAFKSLGGTYAVHKAICEKFDLDYTQFTFPELQEYVQKNNLLADVVFATATDGNHGKGIAWAAKNFGCRSVVYMPKGSSEVRVQAIKDIGDATVLVTELGYDDTVRFAATEAKKNDWILLQDTAWEGYEKVPTWIIQGYTTLAHEAIRQLKAKNLTPTHVFLQAGVGAMAGGILGYLADFYAEKLPTFSIVESNTVACFYQSAQIDDNVPHAAESSGPTIMAGLNCGEICIATWQVIKDFTSFYFSCPDYVAAEGMRSLQSPIGNDRKVISGESGAVTFGLVKHILYEKSFSHLRTQLGLSDNSVILLISTEGNTDPNLYDSIIKDGYCPSPYF